ncbi:MAG: radical SAM protein [Candidatus Omnitrophica bacterium]|nr:radical SAM protein [Candidatus Omnitrophota bacterium]
MKILLIDPPWGNLYGRYEAAAKVGVLYPPLGLCYLSSYLKSAGHEVSLMDCEAQSYILKDIISEISKFKPDAVGIRCVSPEWKTIKKISEEIRKNFNRLPIILGGPHITNVRIQAFEDIDFDFGICGESEFSIVNLVNSLYDSRAWPTIPGLIWKKDGSIRENQNGARLDNIDTILFPDRSILNKDNYLWSVPKKGICRFTTILTSRGCPFRCTFCSQEKMFGGKVRLRSPENSVDEIEGFYRENLIDHFIFVDDTLTMDKDRVYRICDSIKNRKLRITWEGWTHATTVDKDILKAMKDAGLVRLSFGIESGNEEVLKSLRKGTTLKQIRQVYEWAKDVGLETRGSVIFGLPGETRKTVRQTLDFVKSIKGLDQAYFNIAMPYPGTEMRRQALNGEMGVSLLTEEYAELRRHGNVVMKVNDLDPKYLINFQRRAWREFYFAPRRLLYNFFRAGVKAGIINSIAFIKSFILPVNKGQKN